MAWLTTKELSDLRTHLTATLPDTCEIDYLTRANDGMGGWTETWTARGTAISCRLSPARLGIISAITQEQLQEGQAWTLSLDYAQTVAVDDRVIVSNHTYYVQQVNTGESEIGLKRVYLERRE